MAKRQITMAELLDDPDCMASNILLSNTEKPTEDNLIKIALDELTTIRSAISRKKTTIDKHIESLEKTKASSGEKAKSSLIVKGQCTTGVGYIEEINMKG